MSTWNPVDYKVQEVIVIQPGSYMGAVSSTTSISLDPTSVTAGTIIGGTCAYLTAADTFGTSDGTFTKYPLGLFYGNAAKDPYEVSVIFRGGIYELVNWDTTQIGSLALGTQLVGGSTGLLQPLASQASTKLVVATVVKVPTSTTDTLGIKLII